VKDYPTALCAYSKKIPDSIETINVSYIAKVTQHPNALLVIKSMGWLLFQKTFVIVLGIFALGWMARHLGPTNMGILGNASAVVTYFGIFAVGIDATVFIRQVLASPEKENAIMGGATAVLFLTGMISWLALLLWLGLGSQDEALVKQVTAVLGLRLCVVFPAPLAFWFQSRLKTQFTVLPQTASSLFLRGWQIACVLMGGSLVWIAGGEALALLVILLLSIYFYYQCGQSISAWRCDLKSGLALVRASLPALLAGMLLTLLSKMDVLMIKSMLGLEAAGYYTAATSLTESLFFMVTLLSVPLTPLLIKSWKDTPERYPMHRANYAKLCALAGWACALSLAIGSNIAIQVVFGSTYEASKPALLLHAFLLVPCFLGAAIQSFLTIEALLAWLSAFLGTALIVNFLLNMLLIPPMGISGAATASVIASLIAQTLAPLLFKPTKHLGKVTTWALLFPFPNLKMFRNS